MIEIRNNQVYSTQGMFVHRLGTDTYFRRGTVLRGDTVADFEEVEAAPAMTRGEYEARVAELVRERYSESEEFAIQRKAINAVFGQNAAVLAASPNDKPAAPNTDSRSASAATSLGEAGLSTGEAALQLDSVLSEYAAYNAFVEECKARAKESQNAHTPDPAEP